VKLQINSRRLNSKHPKVYFYCREEEGNLQEDIIAIAEGLSELGIPYYANCNYWLQSTSPGDYLFQKDPDVSMDDCDVVVVSYTWPFWIRMGSFELNSRPLPEGLFKKGRRYKTVYLDSHDGHRTVSWESEFRQFDIILRSKLNRRAWRPENIQSWVLGLNNRILQATANHRAFIERRKSIILNFGASHPFRHRARDLACKHFIPQIRRLLEIDETVDDLSRMPSDPYDALMWRQTGGRFSRAYYERLKNSQAVACFCGDLIPAMPFRNPESYLVGGNRAKIKRAFYEFVSLFDRRPRRSVQWDSFRFWEALAAGCVAFNLDLEHYGVEIPVMPTNWVHYIGVDFNRIDKIIQRLSDEPEALERIGKAGSLWALENYTQKAMAQRFLQSIRMAL
jgi:hypothetical protein